MKAKEFYEALPLKETRELTLFEFAEAYHKAKVKLEPPICRRCDTIIRTELNN